MSLSIRTVKPEIRILGLDTCKKSEALGAVIRGGLFLDGAIRLHVPGKNVERELAREIQATRYYPELRAIMLHDPRHVLRTRSFEKFSRLPIIDVAPQTKPLEGYRVHHSERGTLFVRTNLPRLTVDKILKVAWTNGALPEPARVAHLLAKSGFATTFSQ